ncbi:phage tail assembly protein [Pseudomonas viridiflava]|uniref:phage tail assembly protein n=1 Tax=Pseudomonas viridiflava TaxID=33069 RepID=UPI002EBFD5C9|nr:phage tail assembly protein [Pseudomonas viridiflava]
MTQVTAKTDEKPLPSWVVLTDSGAVITLKYPVEINTVKVNKVTMRAPCVRDNRAAAAAANGSAEAHEIALFCSLIEAGKDDLDRMSERDYRRLQEGYFRLVSEDEL